MISWRNLGGGVGDRDIAFDDYRTLGVESSSLPTIEDIVPGRRDPCVWAIASAGHCCRSPRRTMTREGDDRLKPITLLAAQADFTEAGELTLFINESQVGHFSKT